MQFRTQEVQYGHSTTYAKTDRFALHCHTQYECYFFLRGDVRYLVEGVSYTPTPNSILLMASGVFHGMRIESDQPYERCALHFDEGLLPPDTKELLLAPFFSTSKYYPQGNAYRIASFFEAIEDCYRMEPSLRGIALPLRITALLTQLCHMLQTEASVIAQPDHHTLVGSQIVAYINAHLTEPLSLERLSKQFFISRNRLCQSFFDATGATISAYIRQKRLILAQQLRASGQSATEAAANAGFQDYSTYYRTHCKLLHHAPTAITAKKSVW